MDEIDQGRELFSQHGVLVKRLLNWDDQSYGSLNIVEYPRLGKCIEWKPFGVSVVLETVPSNQEWSLVNTIGQTPSYNLSTNSAVPDTPLAPTNPDQARPIRIMLADLRSFSIAPNGQQMTFIQRSGLKHSACFQQYNASRFMTTLCSYVPTSRSKKDKSMFVVLDQVETSQVLDQSFAQLDLFTENKTDAVWKFVDNLQQRPYETTLQAFSKLTDFFLRPIDSSGRAPERELPAELLQPPPIPEDPLGGALESYEVIGLVPALPPRNITPRAQPLDPSQWQLCFDEEGTISNPGRIKEIVFRGGVDHRIRPEVWKFLLDYFPWESTHAQRVDIGNEKCKEYYRMKAQWKTLSAQQESRFSDFRDRKSLIEKDVNRTDRTHPFYSGDNNTNLELLHDILMTYVMYNFDLGYVQGMNDLLSPLLLVMGNEVDSFWCFVGFMERVESNFALDQAGMKLQLHQLHCLLSVVEPDLASYLDHHESGNMYFCFRWLLVVFKREFLHIDVMRVWEVLWTRLPCPNFHLLMCVAVLDAQKRVLIGNQYEFTEILKHINELSMNIELKAMLENAEGIYEQLTTASQLSNTIREIIGLELELGEDQEDSDHPTPSPSPQPSPSINDSRDTVTISEHLGEAAFERGLNTQFL